MLDDREAIEKADPGHALEIAAGQWEQLQYQCDVDIKISTELRSVVLSGMGGSALPAVFLQSWPGISLPFEIVRNYAIPEYVDERTLFISSSYSGNTEEALETLDEAEKRGAQIAVIAAGGKLLDRAVAAGYPLLKIPSGIMPRMATFYFLAAFVQLLEPLGLIGAGSAKELAEDGNWLKKELATFGVDIPESQNVAKQAASHIFGSAAIIYSGPKLFPAANKWKICLNENAKNLAWANVYPELDHNELTSWMAGPIEKPFTSIEIRSNLEHSRVQRRFEVTEKVLSGKRPDPYVVTPRGETLLQQLLWTASLGDFVSIYLGILNGVDPTEIELQEGFKLALG